jgi:putative tryptophan/tyrosine transport system substrate-binding protein
MSAFEGKAASRWTLPESAYDPQPSWPGLKSRSPAVPRFATLANRYRIPAIYPFREDVIAGGFMSYGSSNRDSYRLVGDYTGRILKGERPGELPVQQVTKVEMFLNLKTAKALGITVPLPLLGRADEVIK